MTAQAIMSLDDPSRGDAIVARIKHKKSLLHFYMSAYHFFSCVKLKSRQGGIHLELGSGCGFLTEVDPDFTSSDIIPYPGVDRMLDAHQMDLPANSLSSIAMMNVLHHLHDAEKFFKEAERCLIPGGKIAIFDQYPGIISKMVLKYLHHEAFDDVTSSWKFPSQGPLSSANGALPWLIFFRDRQKFTTQFKSLNIDSIEYVAPLKYWFTGGLKRWNLCVGPIEWIIDLCDLLLLKLSPRMASFIQITVTKKLIECRSHDPAQVN